MTDVLWQPDRGDGTYQNPVLFCDYSDPDAIRVGDTYYMTASSFNYVPGLPILTSKDLVNWTLQNYALSNIPAPSYDSPRHAAGVWAPAIRYHEGYFYIFYGMPDEGIYMVRASDALGTWEAPVLVLPGKGLIDPCPFWDDDGCAYVVHAYARSRIGFKSFLGIFPISPDGKRALGDDHLLYDGTRAHPTLEGPKVYKRAGWYYIFAPAGGVTGGWQTVLRSRRIQGPYEDRVVLRQGDSPINGPHQGAWVETPGGESWFLHFQSRGLYGRVIHLQPMTWREDGWPVIGEAAEDETCGTPVEAWQKPEGLAERPCSLQASDAFAEGLGLQWQFMGNWRDDFFAVENGCLRLNVQRAGDRLWHCPQVLTQKLVCPAFTAEVTLDATGLHPGEQAGFGLVGAQVAYAALRRQAEGFTLVYVQSDGTAHEEHVLQEIAGMEGRITLRMTLLPTGDQTAAVTFEYAIDGKYRWLGSPFVPEEHTWVGVRMALFATRVDASRAECGYGVFSSFRVERVETLD
ncbi:MAG: family 43 glycosylhydrolase [Clostridiales bacterium]|nr:family 43 glycosylhydrolase [Clostridiales bacterium]